MGANITPGLSYSCLRRFAAERGTQRLGNLRRLTVLQHHHGHRPFNRQLFTSVENLIVVADRATSQLADREPQTERSVKREHAEESALHMYAREIVIPAPDIHRPFDATQQFALSLFNDLKDPREVQTPGGICVSPAKTAVQFYESRSHAFSFCSARKRVVSSRR